MSAYSSTSHKGGQEITPQLEEAALSVSKKDSDWLESEFALMDQEILNENSLDALDSSDETEALEINRRLKFGVRVDNYLTEKDAEIARFKKDVSEAKAELARRNAKLEKDLAAMNKRHAVVLIGSKTRILNEATNEKTNHTNVVFQSVADFRTLYLNRLITGEKGKKISLANIWLASPNRRQYEGVEFAPGSTTDGNYNLFHGFAVKPVAGDRHKKYKEFVQKIICGGNAELFDFVWKWIAHIFQKPAELPETALVLRGKQGIGKGVFAGAIGELIGQHFVQLFSSDQLTGRFNSHLSETILVFGNEAHWGGNRSRIGTINSMISERESMSERKGIDMDPIKNYKRLIFASNEKWCVPMDMDDRRFLILDVPSTKKEDTEYFKQISDELNNGGLKNLMYEFMHVDLSGFNTRITPRTNAGMDIKLRSGTMVQKWWYECLASGEIPDSFRLKEDSGTIAKSNQVINEDTKTDFERTNLHHSYLAFCDIYGERFPLVFGNFHSELMDLCTLVETQPRIEGRRPRCYTLPTLGKCRAEFEEKAKLTDFKW